ncbi:unnamed protein product [Blepharisma stoltei]|uniref:Uncharacterized protein n=1 Tax=Blepharisma stoltei TaxID=1481888 RepID=A0AAU9K0D8_9CILI|nr:unnamed protein product [Blepharisma stoltei]
MINWKLLFLIISAVTSKDFGTFYLSEEEWIDLDLHEYFSSNEIAFYISNTNSSSNDISLYQNSSIQLISYVQHELINEIDYYNSSYDENFPIFAMNNNFFVVWFKGKEIVLYMLSENIRKFEKMWNLNVGSKECRGEITQIKEISNKNAVYLIILVRCKINSSLDLWKNEIYILDLKNFYETPTPIHFNLWDIKYLHNLKISSQSHRNFIAIYGNFQSGKQIIFIYEFLINQQICLKLIQSIDQHPQHYKFQENELNIAQIQFSKNQMILLDALKGAFYFEYKAFHNIFECMKYADLSNYGRLYSFSWLMNYRLAVGSDKGIAILESKTQVYRLIYWIDIFDITGYTLPIQSLYFWENLIILKMSDINTNLLLILDIKQNLKAQLISTIDLSLLIGNSFKPSGMWSCIENISGNKFYLRDDYDGIRLYALEPKDWSLRIWGNHSFYAEIAAKTGHKNKKHTKKSFNVISIPLESNDIYTIANNQKIDPDTSINSIFNGAYHLEQIHPKSFFSGPNLTYSIASIELPNDFSVEILQTNKIKDARFLDLAKPPIIIKHNFNEIGMLSEDGLLFYNVFKGEYKYLNGSQNIIDIMWGRDDYTMMTLENGDKSQRLSIYEALPLWKKQFKFITSIEYEEKCSFFKRILDSLSAVIIVCATNQSISIHRIFSTNYIWARPKIYLSEYGINSVASLDGAILQFSPTIILSIIDQYKGLLSLECGIEQLQCKIRQSSYSIRISSIQKIVMSGDFVYLICLDEKIRVLNSDLQYLKTLSPRVKGKIMSSYTLLNFLVLQIDNHIVVLDGSLSSHDSFVYHLEIDAQCETIQSDIFEHFDCPFIFIAIICQKSRISIYEFQCDFYSTNYKVYQFAYNINIYLKDDTIVKDNEFSGKISLAAQNLYDRSVIDINYKISLVDNNILVNYENVPKEIEIKHSQVKFISLKDVFIGDDIRASVKLNNIADEQEWPGMLPIKLQQIYTESSVFTYNSTKFYDHTPIEEINKYILATNENLMILDIKDNYKIEAIIPLKAILNYELNGCTSLTAVGTKNYSVLVTAICTYFIPMENYWNERKRRLDLIISKALVIFEYNSQTKTILKRAFIGIGDANYMIRASKTSDFRYDLFLMKKTSEFSLARNSIFWYKGTWNNEKLTIDFDKEINYSLLGIAEFFAKSIDIVFFKTSIIVLYIVDAEFGLRVLLIDENSQINLVESIPHPHLNSFSSICHSQDKLFVDTFKGHLFRYTILANSSLIFDKAAYSYQNSYYKEDIANSIACMKESIKYVFSVHMRNPSTFLRIWNDMKWTDIKINILFSEAHLFRIMTIGDSKISLIEDNFFTLKIRTLIDPYIEISALSKENYSKFNKIWGKNGIKLEINAYNSFKKTNSAIIYIKSTDQNISHHYWNIWPIFWFATVIFILILFILIILYYKKKKNNIRKEFNEEGLILEEIKHRN